MYVDISPPLVNAPALGSELFRTKALQRFVRKAVSPKIPERENDLTTQALLRRRAASPRARAAELLKEAEDKAADLIRDAVGLEEAAAKLTAAKGAEDADSERIAFHGKHLHLRV